MELNKVCQKCGTTHAIPGSLEQPSVYCPVETVASGTSNKSEVCENTGVPEGMCPCPECLASIEPQSPPVAQVENHHCAKCGWERLLWRPQDKCAHVLICSLCLMTRPHSSQECDKYTMIRIEKLEVQVEVYRKALESAEEWMAEDGCDCGTDEPGTCGLCLVRALLTSKPEPVTQGHDGNCVPVITPDDGWQCDCGYAPVAPVRKWEADVAVGELGLEEYGLHGCATIYVKDLSPEVQDALRGRKG